MRIFARISPSFLFLVLVSFPGAQDTSLNNSQPEYYSIANTIQAEILKKDENSIRISWDAPRETGEIIVARSSSMIDTPEKCMVADSLGKYPSGIAGGVTQIFDYNLKPGTYYYAVVLAHHVKKNTIKLVPGRNFTTIPVVIEQALTPGTTATENKTPELPEDARVTDLTVKKEGKFLRLNWSPYDKAISNATVYTVYRSSEPMSSLSLMRKAEKLTELSHPESTFLDQDLSKSQTFYYGVSVRSGAKEILPLVNGQSFVRFFYIGTPNKNNGSSSEDMQKSEYSYDEMHVKDIVAETEDTTLKLSWKAPDKADENTAYTIYQSLKPLSGGTATFLSGNIRKLGEVKHPDTSAQIRLKKAGTRMFFGVTVKRGEREEFNLVENESFLTINPSPNGEGNEGTPENNGDPDSNGVEVEKEKPDVQENKDTNKDETKDEQNRKDEEEFSGNDDELDRILKKTYWKRDYEGAIHDLKPFTGNGNSAAVRGKAKFFTGLSHYRRRNYKEALKHLISKDSKFYNAERSEFWSKRCLSRISGGNP
ncbi:hypothetical protein EHQ12_08055 [Leptospira gomenensis]|uniref:Tetratricopeptide repeat protein n=1 Tax=Leptospira gomenensis TaxID=2484974 RepID=A0A5F1YD46_9LEPT|nr:hypothetical protein [Leptospira gomenensis]TGK35985.1 hypothetical protein EHQ17_05240 [Leptospira gomenensis]TGK39984.1 hypothetical protein EHQ12_08055 [Leptospira gomenensis]TGK51433.1 hypothetical protein EHQ07_02445 [Leptospira gomenensis]TGK64892.1 hypothetical protein EHQ13_06510 [Leptospira gomenensis]